MDPDVILEETKVVLEEPLPIPEPQVDYVDVPTVAEREARNRLARVIVILEIEERITRGSKVGHNVFHHEVGKRLSSRLFIALGSEGKKKFIQKTPHTEVSKLGFQEIAKISFEKTKCITYESYKLFTRSHETNETLESFHAALTAQAAKAELGGLEEALVRDLFISRMGNVVLQDTLTFETFSPEEVLI